MWWLTPYAALLAVAGFGVVAPTLSRAARPAVATWLLTLGAATSAVSTVTVLAMMALPLVGRDDAFMDSARVSLRLLDKDTGSGIAVAAAALGTLLALLARFAGQLLVHTRARAAATSFARAVDGTPGRLLVIPDDTVDIYAMAGRVGMVVATRGLVRCLSAEQRRAVLAHEHAHLRHHHHRHLSAVTLAASLNPLLSRLPAAGTYAVERWADEVSAQATSRATTAAALARVAERGSEQTLDRFRTRLAAAGFAVAGRIAALQQDAPGIQPLRLAAVAALPVLAAVATGVMAGRVFDVFTLAMSATGHVLPHH